MVIELGRRAVTIASIALLIGCPSFTQAPGQGAGEASSSSTPTDSGDTGATTQPPGADTDGTSGGGEGDSTVGVVTSAGGSSDDSGGAGETNGATSSGSGSGTSETTAAAESGSESTSTAASNCVPEGVLLFDDQWDYFANEATSLGASGGAELVLTEDEVYEAGVAALYGSDITLPYTISFEYRSFDDDGGYTVNDQDDSADGISVILNKDVNAYFGQAPPEGGGRGFIPDGVGRGVHFETYLFRRVHLRTGFNGDGPFTLAGNTYTDGAWLDVSVEVREDGYTVVYDGSTVIDEAVAVAPTAFRVGFGAATGGADSLHAVRNVSISCPGG